MKQLKLYGNRLIIGAGSLEYFKKIEHKRVLIVTGGQSLFKNGTIKRLEDYLAMGHNVVEIFKGIKKNPDTLIVEEGLAVMKTYKPDLVLAIGGGSPIDAAKVMTLLYDYPSFSMATIREEAIADLSLKTEFIAVPTTSGTGTEVTKAAVITFKEDNIKVGLKSEAFIPHIAVIDGELTLSMPDHIVAETGLDALTHALECYINHNLDDYTECLALGAIKGLFHYLPISYTEKTLEAREKVHHYQNIAGMAFHNVGLGMSHGISHAFGGQYDLGHGLLNGICLPYVLTFNRQDEVVNKKLERLSKELGIPDVINGVKDLNKALSIPGSFQDVGLMESDFRRDLDLLVNNSLKGSTVRNPVAINYEQMEKLLQSIYYGDQ